MVSDMPFNRRVRFMDSLFIDGVPDGNHGQDLEHYIPSGLLPA